MGIDGLSAFGTSMDRQASRGHVHNPTLVQGNINLKIARYYQGTGVS